MFGDPANFIRAAYGVWEGLAYRSLATLPVVTPLMDRSFSPPPPPATINCTYILREG